MIINLCENSNFLTILYWIFYLINLIGIIIPALLIVLISFDLFQAVMVFDEKKFKEINNRIVKRIVFLILIFFMPAIINFALNIVGENNYSESKCVLNANNQAILSFREKENNEKLVKKSLFDQQLEEERIRRSEEELYRENKRVEDALEKERKNNEIINRNEVRRSEKDKRNREYEKASFQDVEGELYSPSCIDGDCSSTVFFQRLTKPTEGTKYFPTLQGTLLGQCVWYARGRAQEIVATSNLSDADKERKIQALQNTRGNGGQWYNAAGLSGFLKSKTIPKPGSIISWSNNSYGHVGILEEVKDGKCTFTDGWRTKYGSSWRSGPYWSDVNFRRKTVLCSQLAGQNPGGFNGYVYILE